MNFTSPAEPFKFYGDLMVVLQGSDRIHEDVKRLVDELEKLPTMETLQRIRLRMHQLHEELMALPLKPLAAVNRPPPSVLSESLTRQLELQRRHWKVLLPRYSELARGILEKMKEAVKADLEALRIQL